MKFKTQYNAVQFVSDDEVNTKPSMTLPDQSMTVLQLMQRFANGLGATGARVPIYQDEDDPFDGVDIRTLDLSERYELINSTRAEVRRIQAELKKQEDAKNKDLQRAAFEKEYAARQQQQTNPGTPGGKSEEKPKE